MRSGASLAPTRKRAFDAISKLSRLATRISIGFDSDVLERVEAAAELRALVAVLAMETLDLTEAADLLSTVTGDRSNLKKRLVSARLALWSGTSPGFSNDAPTHSLWITLERDNNAQVDLLRGDRSAEPDVLPVTAARVRAASGDEDGAREILAKLDPARLDAMLRAFPDDAATKAWSRRNSGPYR